MSQSKSQNNQNSKNKRPKRASGITAITVKGYKSIYNESKIDISSLTVLAGTNSSGKSSIMQPLLLMKQTLEASYDPGPILLNGANLKFTSAEQLFSLAKPKEKTTQFSISIEINEREVVTCTFGKKPKKSIDLNSMRYEGSDRSFTLISKMDHESIFEILPSQFQDFYKVALEQVQENSEDEDSASSEEKSVALGIVRDRCFFEIAIHNKARRSVLIVPPMSGPASVFERHIQGIIHVPGLRGNPERTYKTTAVSELFPGRFEDYVASVINHWQSSQDEKLRLLTDALQKLDLTSKIVSKQLNDTQVELTVGRLPCNSQSRVKTSDMVSIADVGFGVSQVLPVLVSLLAASPGQLVYIEQPEIHLHPRAQVALAEIFADAIDRGVRIVVETHSELFLLGIQSLVAEGKLSPDNVKLHWFTQQENGATKISTAELDETGAFGDWPEDFGEISLATQNRYLTAAEAKLWNK